MNTDESLAILLKLVSGDKEKCFQLVQIAREAYPNKSMQWCIQKAIYDFRYGKKSVKPNPKLSRWGEGGGNYVTQSRPPFQTAPVKATEDSIKPVTPPAAEVETPKPKPQETIPSVLPDLAALAKAKRKMAKSQPASSATKQKLYTLTGNHAVSQRLVASIQFNNPDRSEQWAYEKAIYEIERDRI
ncbi:MAG: hypothetical protein NW224_00230 [Leptolyngbyaceae cyanobacterium bins.302]|nr:hypothetical protein [Leptolyngbyaceae cyanobacterium bins.302]